MHEKEGLFYGSQKLISAKKIFYLARKLLGATD